jgi:threonine synthase
MRCDIYVPEGTSAAKNRQIAAHGATVTMVPGSREDCAAAAARAADTAGVFYASHVHNPFFLQGTKTYAYEIWEQLGGVPDTLVLPVGNGTLVLGAVQGLTDLLGAGLVDRLPRVIAVQAEQCAPLARAFTAGRDEADQVRAGSTLAEGIAIAAPARHRQILTAVRATAGAIVTVSEDAIRSARMRLAARGWYVESTAAVSLAVVDELPHLFRLGETVVIPLCGAGLKDARADES